MMVGLGASLVAIEPLRDTAAAERHAASAPLWTVRGFTDAVIGPFAEFFRMYGWLALLMLAAISFYRLPEFMMGPMANPFYHDLGLTKDAVGAVRGSFGLGFSLLGIAAGGISALRLGYVRDAGHRRHPPEPRHRGLRDPRVRRDRTCASSGP